MAEKRVPSSRQALKGKFAVLTGGSKGIGLAIAAALSREGCSVMIAGRDRKALNAATNALGKNVVVSACDICDPKAVAVLFNNVRKRFGKLDFLINNAGVAHALLEVEKLPFDVWKRVIDTNLTGMFLVTHHALPLMPEGGVIVNNLSVAAVQTFEGLSAYNASKSGALGFTNTLRAEVWKRGIRVTALMPGAVATDIWQQFWPDAPRANMLSPETIAELVLSILKLPPGATVEQIQIGPTSGAL